ncbi:MAG: Asp-tRNA(Asn)/Glu-tRNA(Gln) amidotransferase subunit GatA [Candidatus Zixiibacteriota bacterium]|nr:MAG: Asp-tRNA(Asn)/Glu-tRNA(Gln) amidotransferase subunit GatA [candidate division Zixibacteria bacterium]
MHDYATLSASAITEGLKNKNFSAVEICRAAISAARDTGQKLNAFISIAEEKAIKQAEAIDRKLAAGKTPGRLAGVPVALKDNICYTDYPTTCGSHILENFVPPYDATCVKKLLEADAVVIGKTNMDEFGMGSSSENSYFGPVKNPIGGQLVPGGSSGGSAGAVAAGIVPVAFGSDTGGSIRQPAAFCGVYGLKPTYGAVSRYGLVAFASSMDQIGPFARNARDVALAYSAVCGKDDCDTTSKDFDQPDFDGLLDTDRKFRIGLPKEYFQEGLDSEVAAKVENAADVLRKAGHEILNISLPRTPLAIATYYIIANAEASSNLARYDGVKFGLREADDILAVMYSKTRSAGFGTEVKRRIMLGTYVLSAGYYEAYYHKAQQVRELIKDDFANAFKIVDLLLAPTTPTPPFKIGEKIDDPLAMYLSDIFTVPANLAGIPALSIPIGTTSDGRPVGGQFMAPAFGELSLFQIAGWFERTS